MKLVSASLLGLTAAIAGLCPVNGQECQDLMAGDACSGLTSPTTCEGENETELRLAVCCAEAEVAGAEADVAGAQADVAGFETDVADAEAVVAAAEQVVTEAKAELALAEGDLGAKQGELATAEGTLAEKQEDLADLCSEPPPPPPPPPPTAGWTPTVGQTWNYHLNAGEAPLQYPEDVDPGADVYMIDMDGDHVPTTIAALHADNKYVVCYISIGTWEVYRDDWGYDDGDDTNDFPDAAIGSILYDWPGEKWLDTTYVIDGETEPAVYKIMRGRVQKAKALGCDGIEPDNMSIGYETEPTGVPVTREDSRNYADWFRVLVQDEGMKVGLKNLVWDDDAELPELAAKFDFGINEECYQYNECALPKAWFIDVEKPVFHVEYREPLRRAGTRGVCTSKQNTEHPAYQFSTIFKTYPLYGPYCTCGEGDIWRTCAKHLET